MSRSGVYSPLSSRILLVFFEEYACVAALEISMVSMMTTKM